MTPHMKVVPMPCPYCGIILDAVSSGKRPPAEGDLTLCCHCGEILLFGPRLSLLKCDLTPEQLADKIGLVAYGTLLQLQNELNTLKLKKQLGIL